jgi:acetyl esterase
MSDVADSAVIRDAFGAPIPLTPDVAAVVIQAGGGGPVPLEVPIEQHRAMSKGAVMAMAGPPTPVARVEDVRLPVDGGEIALRVYVPAGEGPFPIAVFFHGGGWYMIDLEGSDGHCRFFADRMGAVVVSVDYRLAPEHPYPAPMEDCYAATCWAAAHAADYGADAGRLMVFGDSAGGQLAAGVTLLSRERGGPAIHHQCLIYAALSPRMEGPSYDRYRDGPFATYLNTRASWDMYVPVEADRALPHVAPLDAPDLAGLPPATIVVAAHDLLRDDGEAYVARLRDAGVPAELIVAEGMVHAYLYLLGVAPSARAEVERLCVVLRERLQA